jgi:hypothetical protein
MVNAMTNYYSSYTVKSKIFSNLSERLKLDQLHCAHVLTFYPEASCQPVQLVSLTTPILILLLLLLLLLLLICFKIGFYLPVLSQN